jgi:hypothetical protein
MKIKSSFKHETDTNFLQMRKYKKEKKKITAKDVVCHAIQEKAYLEIFD